jgi:hypothetical protein
VLVEALTAIATDFTLDDAIDALDWIYADPENTSDLIKLAFKRIPKHLQRNLGRVFKTRQSRLETEAMGDFEIGDLVIISDDCAYRSLSGVELVIDHLCYPWIACTRPSGTTAPGLLKTDIAKYRLWPH